MIRTRSRWPRRVAVLSSLTLSALLARAIPAQAVAQRATSITRWSLTIDGPVVFVRSIEGGNLVGQVALEPQKELGPKKHLANIAPEDISVAVGAGGRPLLDMVASALTGRPAPRDLTLTMTDLQTGRGSERVFRGSVVNSWTVPTLDASSRSPAYFTIGLSPAAVVSRVIDHPLNAALGMKEKAWMASNFRVEMDGLDGNHVTRIDSFTVRMPLAGGRGDAARAQAVEIPNITITLADAGSASWSAWADDFLVNGKNSDANEKNGAIILLSADLKTEMVRITLGSCGLVRLAPAPLIVSVERSATLVAELYCEQIGLDAGK